MIVAGLTYCGVCTLSLLGKLPSTGDRTALSGAGAALDSGFVQDILHWLMYRQSTTLFEEEQLLAIPVHSVNRQYQGSGAYQEAQGSQHHLDGLSAPIHHEGPLPGAFVVQGASLDGHPIQSSPETSRTEPIDLNWIGLNGRTNKVADTCYSFWVGGTLGVSHFVTLYMQVG
jgi:geranylgeranyl transferase type-1 subunit beta